MGRYKSQTWIAHLGLNEECSFFKHKLFNVCANFTKVSFEIRDRVISQGLIIFLRRSKVSDPSGSGLTFVPACLGLAKKTTSLTFSQSLTFIIHQPLSGYFL